MFDCEDVVFGPYCVYRTIRVCREQEELVDDAVVKKEFIDTYNRCKSFVTFKQSQNQHEGWDFPPVCMQDNSYSYAVFWYEWTIEGLHEMQDNDNDSDDSFN